MFAQEDGTSIKNEDGKYYIRKNAKIYLILQLLKSPKEKSEFLKIAAQALEAVDFLKIFLRFWGF